MTDPTSEATIAGRPNGARIAVIAVHGVADQAPNETARSVADLLLGVRQAPQGTVAYGRFVETPLRIEVRRLEPRREAEPEHDEDRRSAPPEPPEPPKGSEGAAPLEAPRADEQREILGSEFAAHLERRHTRRARKTAALDPTAEAAPAPARDEVDEPAIDLQFTSMQIARYEATLDSPSYDTLCLSAERVAPGARGRTQVDVYEMYWADLSRLGSGLLRIAGELYQLFFHLSSLGRNTVDLGADANSGKPVWRALRLLQRCCNWTLSVPIGLLNMYLPILVLLLALALVPADSLAICAAAVWALLGMLAGAALMYRESWQPIRGWWPFPGWLAVQIAGLAIGWKLGSGLVLLPAHWLVGGALMIAFVVAHWLSVKYDNSRPGALRLSRVIMLVLFVTFAITAPADGGTPSIAGWIMRQVEIVFFTLVMLWTLLIPLQILSWCAGEWVLWRAASDASINPESPRQLARRVVWTGRLGFALSSSLFMVVTLSAWAVVLFVLPTQKFSKGLVSMTYVPSIHWLGHDPTSLGAYAGTLLNQSGGPLFNAFFVCVLLSLLMLLWAALPSVVAEIAPPRNAERAASRRLGFWLDHGFRLARLAGSVLVFGLLVVLTTGFILKDRTGSEIQAFLDGASLGWLYTSIKGLIGDSNLWIYAGMLLGGTTLGVVALGSRLGKVSAGLRPILDIALDVDNWLRENPLKHNPKSRILARYSSLLRHIGARRESGKRHYDAVVIVAHSQGTVITADLLRYLHAQPERWPFDGDVPLFLLTMGCPLRQLYGLRFPHLYAWARYDLKSEPRLRSREERIPTDRKPLPGELGVALWVNAYRSGDYVGRRLWIRDDDPARWDPATPAGDSVASDAPANAVAEAKRIEFCIGAGAHTHYFDQTAARVGEAIDQLISIAAVGKANYPSGYPVFSN